MKPLSSIRPSKDPCLPIQVDLSCMIDGELEESAIRRVLVHAEVCPSCGAFLRAIRSQATAHGALWATQQRLPGVAAASAAGLGSLAEQLMRGRVTELARVFYELGRAYVHLVVSPAFRRVVAREPVPIPEYRLRGRALIDEVAVAGGGRRLPALTSDLDGSGGRSGREWTRARALLNGHLDSAGEHLSKGQSLLQESLALKPNLHDARIYLGHACQLAGNDAQARTEFRRVLRATRSPVTRAFALENLGSSYLAAGELAEATRCFVRLIESGVIERERRFFTAFLNLAAAGARAGDVAQCAGALLRLWDSFPDKREWVRGQILSHPRFRADIAACPGLLATLGQRLPQWFPTSHES